MKLEQQVLGLELAQKLKELGVKQESEFYHYQSNESIMKADVGKKFWYLAHKNDTRMRNCDSISAFTVAELGELLKKVDVTFDHAGSRKNPYRCHYNIFEKTVTANTEADARAKCLVYLLENKLITL